MTLCASECCHVQAVGNLEIFSVCLGTSSVEGFPYYLLFIYEGLREL